MIRFVYRDPLAIPAALKTSVGERKEMKYGHMEVSILENNRWLTGYIILNLTRKSLKNYAKQLCIIESQIQLPTLLPMLLSQPSPPPPHPMHHVLDNGF